MAETREERRSRWHRTLATFAHNLAFTLAIAPVSLRNGLIWNWIGIALLVATLAYQLLVWRKILETSIGLVAGTTTAMYLFYTPGPSTPNIALAVILVGAEIVLVLVVESLRRWRRERLTPPSAEP